VYINVTQLSGQSDELCSMTLFVLHGQAATGYCDTGSIALQSIVNINSTSVNFVY